MSSHGNGYYAKRESFHVRSAPLYTQEFSSRRSSQKSLGHPDVSSHRTSRISGGQQVFYTTGSQQMTGTRTVRSSTSSGIPTGTKKKYIHTTRGVGYTPEPYGPDGVVVLSQPHHTDHVDHTDHQVIQKTHHIEPQQQMIVANRPNDYLGLSLFSCLCCFCPVGLVALFYSLKSRKSTDKMDYGRGYSNGKRAKLCSIVAIVIGIILFIILFILLVTSIVLLDRAKPEGYVVFG